MTAEQRREAVECAIWKASTDAAGRPVRITRAAMNKILKQVDALALDVAARQVGMALAQVPEPPRVPGLGEPPCDAESGDGWLCTAQRHHAPPHLAHGPEGRIMAAWTAEHTRRAA